MPVRGDAKILGLPDELGTYVLLLHLPARRVLRVGALGPVTFSRGHYAYVGSARGPGGLRGRLQHHLRRGETPHWHVDYFRAVAAVRRVWFRVGEEDLEHAWSKVLGALPGATVPARRLGATDCRCPAHLFRFATGPSRTAFREAVERERPGGGRVRSWVPEAAP